MNHTEETRTAIESFSRGGAPRGWLLAQLGLSTLFLLSSFPLGLLWFGVLAVLLLAGLPLTIVWVGLPILALAMPVCVLGTRVERRRLAVLLGARVSSPYRPLPRGSALAHLRARA